MHFELNNANTIPNIEAVALQKIQSLIASFHTALLSKRGGSGVYRDLSEKQQYLLDNLGSENPLHSILAGCLAIDSCFSTISKQEQNVTNNIIKSATTLSTVWQSTQNELMKYFQNKSLTINKIQLLWKQVEVGTKNLLTNCLDLPYSQLHDEIKKHQKILLQQDISFKQIQTNVLEEPNNEQIKQLLQQNKQLKQEVSNTQKKTNRLTNKINNHEQLTTYIPEEQQTQQTNKKSSSSQKEQHSIHIQNGKLPQFSPSSSNQTLQKQLQILRQKSSAYEKSIQKITQQFNRDKNQMMRHIFKLQQKLKIAKYHQDFQLDQLLQQLQDQIEILKQQRRNDLRIVRQVQQKLQGISMVKDLKIRQHTRKASNVYENKNDFSQDVSERGNQSKSLKKNQGKARFYGNNYQDVSKSTIQMQKQNHNDELKSPKYNQAQKYLQPAFSKEQFQQSRYPRILPMEQLTFYTTPHPPIGKHYAQNQQKGRKAEFYPTAQSNSGNDVCRVSSEKNMQRKVILPQQPVKNKNQFRFAEGNDVPPQSGRYQKKIHKS